MIPAQRGAPSERHRGASVWPLAGFSFGLEIQPSGCRLVARTTDQPVELTGDHLGDCVAINEAVAEMLWIVDFADLGDYES